MQFGEANLLGYEPLLNSLGTYSAIRRRRRLQPAGGVGDKIFPPTYPGEGQNAPPRHVFERRRIEGRDVVCVLIDSVQSQANRLEEALLASAVAGNVRLPRVFVDFPAKGLNSVPPITSLEAPHRIFDAILRDSTLDGKPFKHSEVGKRLIQAKANDATAILEISPTALLFGVWNSTGEGGALGAKFARTIVSEIFGVGVPVEEVANARTGEITLRSAGRRTGSRIDPLGILRSVDVFKTDTDWYPTEAEAGKKSKKVRPSEINHGNIAPSVDWLGVTCDYAQQTAVITLAGLRRLRFGDGDKRDAAGRAYICALGLLALAECDAQGYALRSRCDLVCDDNASLEFVRFDGVTEPIELDLTAARALHEAAFDAAATAGFSIDPAPLRLLPQDKLVEIVRRSQDKALRDEGGEAGDG
jgi:CRISPR-associated protein Csb1